MLKNLRTRFERFCLQNRDKGIPYLMLYIIVGSAIVFILSMFNGGSFLFELLRFDKTAILKGQVWRLFTYVLTYSPGSSPFMILISFYFFYNLSRHVEMLMGTFRFNLFYFSGVLLMDIFAMLFCPTGDVMIGHQTVPAEVFSLGIYSNMAFYLHLSILLMFATVSPDSQFLILFIIPVKAWFMGLVYLILIAADIWNASLLFPHNLFSLIGLLNYLLFAGPDVLNLFPFISRRPKRSAYQQQARPIPFRPKQSEAHPQRHSANYSHRCTVCGRTDVSDPDLEFRYCSRCNGYHCYCEDHINNHTHI